MSGQFTSFMQCMDVYMFLYREANAVNATRFAELRAHLDESGKRVSRSLVIASHPRFIHRSVILRLFSEHACIPISNATRSVLKRSCGCVPYSGNQQRLEVATRPVQNLTIEPGSLQTFPLRIHLCPPEP
jgi:hypothetical protein